jgi:predicted HAD superfamily Cof-like phosphohydrolase
VSVSPANLVQEFHRALQRIRQRPLTPTERDSLRQRLLEEEVAELAAAVATGNPTEIAHELADVVYVAYGTAAAYGFDLDAVIAEVHRSNMTKFPAEGDPVFRADGKLGKGTSYVRSDIARIVPRQSLD